ncbi:VC0807 family protein [Paraburkholderia sp. J76]|uniref:VC0807 family protein n=1 Tax=Paraburkholderia sp. J76 TaxID=2805439 RepID=UPI002ABE428B|nr:VC0807 family protein [Paraburkholderia sp. J76]
MIPSSRYAFAFVVNAALPAAVYWLTLARLGVPGALAASAAPLLAWMIFDLVRFRHFDALSALVLASIGMSLVVLASASARWLSEAREPLVSGVIGVIFLLSLPLERPLVFYLGRSTLSRERSGREREFDEMWQNRPALVRSIRLMTAVWGLGLVGENAVRIWLVCCTGAQNGDRLSMIVRYATYFGLTAWSIVYRNRYVKRQA